MGTFEKCIYYKSSMTLEFIEGHKSSPVPRVFKRWFYRENVLILKQLNKIYWKNVYALNIYSSSSYYSFIYLRNFVQKLGSFEYSGISNIKSVLYFGTVFCAIFLSKNIMYNVYISN